MDYKLRVMEFDPASGVPHQIGTKTLYSADGRQAARWVRVPLKGMPPVDAPQLKSALAIKDAACRGSSVENALGYMSNNANSVYDNATLVFLLSAPAARSHGLPVHEANFQRVVALFCARRSIARTWLNWQDEYLTPDTDHPAYEQWVNDTIVYSLFNTKSNQSALRGITYKSRNWDIRNQFFWLSHEEVLREANRINFTACVRDAEQFPGDTYVYNQLRQVALSPDATAVLDYASRLVRESWLQRKAYHQDHPELHLQAWDAGWAQLKPLLKERFSKSYETFRTLYKSFEDRMREGVYTFGFLRR